MSKEYRVYLSGPISNIEPELATGWRNDAAKLLEPQFEIIDPMAWDNEFLIDPEAGAKRDLAELYHSSVVLLNLTHAPDPALLRGTTVELAMWGAWQIIEQSMGGVIHGPVVAVYKDKAQEESLYPWITMLAPKAFYDVEKAIQWLNLESSTWTTEGSAVNQPSDNSLTPSLGTETPPSGIVGPGGQPLSSETSSGPDTVESPTS